MMKTKVIKMRDGVHIITVVNASGALVEFCNLGARWTRCCVPDANGHLDNVLVGTENYANDTLYRGAIVGRVANRIAHAQFELEGQTYHLDANDGRHSNHGGFHGFDGRRWDYQLLDDGVTFMLTSADGDGGYPGTIDVQATYRWDDDCRMKLHVVAHTDQATLFNPTCHAYFNLSSGLRRTIADHKLVMAACKVVETDGDTKRATLMDGETGRVLEVRTSLPGIVLYTSGWSPRRFEGVCLEAQFWPDAVHHASFEASQAPPWRRV